MTRSEIQTMLVFPQTVINIMHVFLLQNMVICVVFALCLFAGGVVSALYSADDHQLSPDICATSEAGKLNEDDREICTSILEVKISQGISAVSGKNRIRFYNGEVHYTSQLLLSSYLLYSYVVS